MFTFVRFVNLAFVVLVLFGTSNAYGQAATQVEKFREFNQTIREFASAMRASKTEPSSGSISLEDFVEREFARMAFATREDVVALSSNSSERYAVLDALGLRAFYSISEGNAIEFEQYAFRVDAKGGLRRNDIGSVYGTLISARLFDRAQIWHAKLNSAARESFPQIVDPTLPNVGRTVWVAHRTDNVLTRREFHQRQGAQVVVVASPICHFSVAAMESIAANTQLSKRLLPMTDWIVPPEQRLSFEKLQQWNREHANVQLALTHRKSDWSELNEWDTPQFYFLVNGTIIRRVTGWPKGGNVAAVTAALDEIERRVARQSNEQKID